MRRRSHCQGVHLESEVAVPLLVLAALAFAPAAWARTCAVTITGTDQMSFDQTQIKVAADCTDVALTLKHSGKLAAAVRGHNWVLTNPGHWAVEGQVRVRLSRAVGCDRRSCCGFSRT
nr:plastocyanin/azurin family copper-binding protein [Xanthomonas hyacinthi]